MLKIKMDWKQILSQSPDNWDDVQKDEIFEHLIQLKKEKIDKKQFKKFFELAQYILRYKGEMVTTLLNDLEQLSTRDRFNEENMALLEENIELKNVLEESEAEKTKYKVRIKELNEELMMIQRKRETASGDESPDILSEIDRHEELLNNISLKNKHIKQLLRDIESLEQKTVGQSEYITELKLSLNEATVQLTQITNQLKECKQTVHEQTQTIQLIGTTNTELMQQIDTMEQDKYERELEIQAFGKQIEERALQWRKTLRDKDERMDSLRSKYDEIMEQMPGYNIDADRVELKKLVEALRERDTLITELESNLSHLTQELIHSTELINNLANEREKIVADNGPADDQLKSCCSDVKKLLGNSTERCQELQDIIVSLEEDNIFKSKQALEALDTLKSYQSGENGLEIALKKNQELQHKLNARDKQIHSLVMDLNDAQNLAQENCVLRKQLGIADDESVSTKSFMAKQKKMEKLNERLTLKLRASEEMRLQLKLEKNDLRRKLSHIASDHNEKMDSDGYTVPTGPDELNDELKICEKCLGQYNRFAIRKLCQNCEQQQKSGFCEDCQRKYGINNEEKHLELKQQYEELDRKYEIVVEENENLRLGMHEILTKLREYDAESDNIVIDAPTLEKLLHALDARSVSGWYNPAMRIQNELIASKEREIVLKNQVRISENILRNRQPFSDTKIATVKDEDDAKISPQSLPKDYDKEILQQPHTDDDPNILKDVPKFLQEYFFVKNKEIDELTSKLNESIEKYRDNQLRCDELKVYEERVREVFNSLNNSEDEKELLVAKQYEALMKCEAEIKIHQRKVEFLTGDNQYLDKMSKSQKEQSNTLIFELQKQLIEQQKIIKQYQKHKYSIVLKNVNQFNEQQQNEITKLKLKLSQLTGIFVKYLPSIDEKNPTQINFEKLQTYGIIDNENIVQFITRFEYQTLEEKCQIAEKRCNELQLENKYLVELLDVHKNQINKQQEMISKTSEDDITLRHLVVDMQSTTNEKYIIAKQCRENQQIKESNDQLLNENQKLQQQISQLKNEIEIVRIECQSREDSYQNSLNSTELKLKFVTKSLAELRQNYSQFMPLYPIIDFVQDYTNLLELSRTMEQQQQQTSIQKMQHTDLADMIKYLQDHGNDTEMEDKIQILKYQMQCKHLENQLRLFVNQIDELKSMVDQQKMREINWTQHWNTIQLLFEENQVVTATTILIHKECQTTNDVADKCFNTDLIEVALSSETIPDPQKLTPNPTLLKSPTRRPDHEQHNDRNANKSLESQLKQAMILASTRSGLLLETENRLAIAQSRIKVLERTIEENEHQLKEERENLTRKHTQIKDDSVLSVTITSLQNLLMEKDNNLVRFQELLRGERQDRPKSYTDYKNEIKDLQGTVDMLEIKIKTKDREIESVRSKLNDTMQKLSDEYERSSGRSEIARSHFKEEYLSDKCIEDMFLNERNVFDVDHGFETADLQNKIKDKEGEIKMLQTRLRDVNNRGKLWEKSLMEKDKEIAELNQKLNENQLDFKDISESISSRREIEQLREMLEEKDRHINDLTDTLTHFHDDQQRYINDTTIDNAEQVSQLSADLNRSEATNRILTTQLDALKRQIVNVTQREKQARDLVKSFKTQLIKRPVISVKTERPTINREEHLQKRIHQLENDLMIAKEELRKQTNLAQSRRAKDAAELALWDKQKRFQQLADNLKLKLSERESEVEKFKSNFNTAKMTISRLEREKHILENRLRSTNRYCQSPSCPNLHATKYTPAESPESYMTTQSDFGCLINPTESGGNKSIAVVSTVAPPPIDLSASQEIIEVLKARIENQQRKIISMELNAKGGNAMTVEFEKIQEKLANAEAQNVRLEARNLQLQLDVDILRQGDNEDRNQRQIKHLEDYILALKNELSHALAANGLNGIGNGSNTNSAQMEQTILALRGIVEKLKVENKNLKDGKKISVNTSNVSKEMFDKQRNEIEKLQQTYSEALDKISALQIELEIQSTTCTKCKEIVAKHAIAMSHGNDSKNIELNSIKEKLIQKTQLLEKAKILLTRAAAKEKHFREQIIYWKRRCSELQNVPVIDEASESG